MTPSRESTLYSAHQFLVATEKQGVDISVAETPRDVSKSALWRDTGALYNLPCLPLPRFHCIQVGARRTLDYCTINRRSNCLGYIQLEE